MDNNLIRLFLDAAQLGSFPVAGSVRGVVKISAPSDLGRNVLMRMLDDFRKRHPDVQYALTLSGNASNMVQDDPDLVLRYG